MEARRATLRLRAAAAAVRTRTAGDEDECRSRHRFEYERATSVEHALALLRAVGGSEARILAGGHSLLPMMKLRLATPEYLIDIDELADELGYIREPDARDEIRIGAMTRHRELLESPLLADRAPIFTDAERVIADPDRPQPRHDRRRPVPGRPVRGSERGLRGGRRADGDPRSRRRARCRDGRVSSRPISHACRGRRAAHRDPGADAGAPAAPTRRSTGARATGRWRRPARRVTLDEDGAIADAGIGLAAVGAGVSCPEAQASLRGERPTDEADRARGGDRGRVGVRAGHRPARLGRVQAPRRRRCSCARALRRAAARSVAAG